MTDDAEELAERLRAAVGRFVRATRAEADTLSPPQAAALGLLDRRGSMSIRAMADGRGVKHQSMSRSVAELETLGLIERKKNPADGREILLSITPVGRERLDEERAARRGWLARALSTQLTHDEQLALAVLPDLLDRIAAAHND